MTNKVIILIFCNAILSYNNSFQASGHAIYVDFCIVLETEVAIPLSYKDFYQLLLGSDNFFWQFSVLWTVINFL